MTRDRRDKPAYHPERHNELTIATIGGRATRLVVALEKGLVLTTRERILRMPPWRPPPFEIFIAKGIGSHRRLIRLQLRSAPFAQRLFRPVKKGAFLQNCGKRRAACRIGHAEFSRKTLSGRSLSMAVRGINPRTTNGAVALRPLLLRLAARLTTNDKAGRGAGTLISPARHPHGFERFAGTSQSR
jgi:hypothetical protein